MAINVAEITSILKQEIAGFEQRVQVSEVGTVIEVGDGIARIYGLRGAMAGELLEFENGTMGQVFNLEEDTIGGPPSSGSPSGLTTRPITASPTGASSRRPVDFTVSPSLISR